MTALISRLQRCGHLALTVPRKRCDDVTQYELVCRPSLYAVMKNKSPDIGAVCLLMTSVYTTSRLH